MAFVWRSYSGALQAQPVLTKACTSLVGFAAGDVLTQTQIEGKEVVDLSRTMRFASFGFFVHGTGGHYFYGWMDRFLPGTAMKTVFQKVAIDQLCMNPIFHVALFSWLGFTEGKDADEIQGKVQSNVPMAVVGSWMYWIPAHTLNFKFVPTQYRILYINVIQLGYNTFLSFLGNRDITKPLVPLVDKLPRALQEMINPPGDDKGPPPPMPPPATPLIRP